MASFIKILDFFQFSGHFFIYFVLALRYQKPSYHQIFESFLRGDQMDFLAIVSDRLQREVE